MSKEWMGAWMTGEPEPYARRAWDQPEKTTHYRPGDRVTLRTHATGTVVEVADGLVTVKCDAPTWTGPAESTNLLPGDEWMEIEPAVLVPQPNGGES